ncbi:MAG: hypothetical protein ACOY3Y_21415 [Acidobacteriota bacterium]
MRAIGMAAAVLLLGATMAHGYPGKGDVSETFVYSGPDRVGVDVLDLKGGKALLRIRGVEGVFSGKVLEHKKEFTNDKNPYYVTSYRGQGWRTLQRGQRWGRYSWTLYVPGVRDGISVGLDEKKGKALDVDEVLKQHAQQAKSGALDAIAKFNRKEEEKSNNQTLAEAVKEVQAKCGGAPSASIDWGKIKDEDMKGFSIGSYCSGPLEAMASLCASSPAAASAVRATLKSVVCIWKGKAGMKEPKLAIAGGKGTWTVAGDSGNTADHAKAALQAAGSVGKTVMMGKTDVCVGDGKTILVAPHDAAQFPGVSYGKDGEYTHVPTHRYLGAGWFFDPFHGNPSYNSDMRGYDLRVFANVDVNAEKKSCTLSCGGKKTQLKLADNATKMKLLGAAKIKERAFQREPRVLAQDAKGVYYYVDAAWGKDADFRLFVGRKGAVKAQKVKDATPDSDGFTINTAAGSLQVERYGAKWTGKGKPEALKVLPVWSNAKLVFVDLGIYKLKGIGTPCDE